MGIASETYEADGSTDQFTVPFPYLDQDSVNVEVDGVEVDFEFVSDFTVQLDSTPTSGASVHVFRETDREDRVVTFTDTSTLVASNLETNSDQIMYVMQELTDDFDDLEERFDNLALESGNLPAVTASDTNSMMYVNAAGDWARGTPSTIRDALSLGDIVLADAGTALSVSGGSLNVGTGDGINVSGGKLVAMLGSHLSFDGSANIQVDTGNAIGDIIAAVTVSGQAGLPALRGDNLTNIPFSALEDTQAALQTVIVEDRKTTGDHGGDYLSADGWVKRDLNTDTPTPDSATVGAWFSFDDTNDQFTLQPGVYSFKASVPMHSVSEMKGRLYDVTNSEVALDGTNARTSGGSGAVSIVHGTLTVAAETTYQVESRGSANQSSYGLGYHANFAGTDEVYTSMEIVSIK